MKNIINDKRMIEGSYLKFVFFRSNRIESDVSLYDWTVLTIIEFIFGEELLEQLVITSAYNNDGSTKTGHLLHLNDMVPSGILTNFFSHKICQLLYYKFYRHYGFLCAERTINENEETDETGNNLNLKGERFAMNHNSLYQVIAFRRVYILQWIVFNLSIDIIFLLSVNLQAAVVSALTIEGFRRLMRL